MNKIFIKSFVIIVLFALVHVLVSLPCHAATVLIDWSTANDISGSADANGNYWNSLGPAGVGNDIALTELVDTNNSNSGISVSVDTEGQPSNFTGVGFGGTGINGPTGPNPFDLGNATADGMYANYNANGTAFITFTNIVASAQYDFSAIGGRASGGRDGVIKVLQGTADTNAVVNTLLGPDPVANSYPLLNDGTVLDFSVTSTTNGVIEIRFFESVNDIDGSSSSCFNALSITPPYIPPAGTIITVR